MKRLILKPKEERRLLRGHLWAYRNEFRELPALEEGELVHVQSSQGRFVGVGFAQNTGGIAVRVITHQKREPGEEFFGHRIARAKKMRDALYPGEDVYRWVNAESDGLPGLAADRYGPWVAARTSCVYYREVAGLLAQGFLAHAGIEGVRIEAAGEVQNFGATFDAIDCTVGGFSIRVDPGRGQKTGLFLDQRENWCLLHPFAAGAKVFDGHCYTGAWSLSAAAHGARQVVGMDTSSWAIETARVQAERNGFGGVCEFECADVRTQLGRGGPYDIVMLDPPALAGSRRHLAKALGLYRSLNRDAMAHTTEGGVLITSSCSGCVDEPAFLEMLKRAANAARRQTRLLALRGAGRDHPVLLAMPETRYLKCAVLQVM